MEGKGLPQAYERLEKAYVPTVLRNWAVFGPTQILNFALVPHHMRVVVVGTVSLFWNTYLSMVNAESEKERLMEATRDDQPLQAVALGSEKLIE
ncbi:hypothetical protein EW026_g4577 [Hermanssonia centrifuga]|uniref:Mpv17-like protein n=1 Tax=Hermanssonia centrifuga TaxID=98765 RepID=A0A4S4KL73_9APHY|nr:hypothetical protein EW026_g4577 [Hermanssonia centrifuga]